MTPTATRLLKTALLLAVAAATSSGLVQAQLPQAVGAWSVQGSVADPRTGAASVVLDDGRTLVLGGRLADGTITDSVVAYDPVTNGVTSVGHLFAPRVNLAAARLEDGRVVVSGGHVGGAPSGDVEIFDPVAGTSTFAAAMAVPRAWHAAAQLSDDRVLIVGGATTDGSALATAEIFDLQTSSVAPAGAMATPRVGLSATTLLQGHVLIAGGNNGGQDLASAEIFDPYAGNVFVAVPTAMSVARAGHTAVLLPHNAGVLIAGGISAGAAVTAADLFLPAIFPDPYSWGIGSFAATGSMAAPRAFAFGGPAGDNGFAYAAGGGTDAAEAYRFATIKTDKDDYAPGELAIISGSGWQPGEAVTLVFQEDPAVHADYSFEVIADALGNIYWNQWAPEEHDFGVRFYLTAQGQVSRAQTTLTDGGFRLRASTGSTFTASYFVFPGTTNHCSTVPPPAGSGPFPAAVTDSTGPSLALANNQYGKFLVPIVSNEGGTYTSAVPTGAGATVVSNTLNAAGTHREICFQSNNNSATNLATLTINYTASATSSTTVDAASATYGNASVALSATVTSTSPVNVGTVTFTVKQGLVTIGTATTSGTVTGGNANVTYALPGGLTAGAYTIEASYSGGAGVSSSTGTGSLTVNPRPVTVLTQDASKTYGTADPAPLTTVDLSSFLAADTITATLTRDPGDTVGTYHITTTLVDPNNRLGNYDVTNAGATFTINQKPVTVLTQPASKIYGDADPAPLTSSDLSVFLAADTITVTFDRDPGDTVGTYHITTTLVDPLNRLGNYAVTNAGATFTINQKPVTVITQPASKIYGDEDPTPLTTANLSGFLADDTISATFAREPGNTVGTYHITTTLVDPLNRLGNYDVTNAGATFTINQKPVTVVTQAASKVYGEDDPTPLTSADLSGFLAADTITATFDRDPGDTVGPYHITTTLVDPNNRLGNYDVTNAGATFTINQKPVTVVTQAASKVYGEVDPTPLTSADLSGFLGDDTITATFAREPGNAAGTYHITTTLVDPLSRLGNYDVTNAGATFTINQRLLTVTATGVDKFYDGTTDATVNLTHDALAGDDVTADYVSASFADKNVGENLEISVNEISLSGEDAGNYTLGNVTTATAYADIMPRPASVTPNAAGKIYGDPEPTLTGSLSGFVAADGITATYARTAGETVAGNPYTISATLSPTAALSNYDITYNTAVFTISQRQASVTPNPANKVYGDPEPTLTGSLSGFLTADGVTATYARTSGETVAGNPYTISATLSPAAVLGNYAITYNTAPFTIMQRPASVTPNPASKAFGAPDPTLTGTLSGFLAADGVTATYSRTIGETVTGSPYTISATLSPAAVLGNYAITYNTAPFTITAWALSGFYQPVGIPNTIATAPGQPLPAPLYPVWNTIKGGQTVPLKFELFATAGGTELTSVADVLGFTLAALPCSYGYDDPVDPDFTTQGATVLRYSDGQFIQNWETPKGNNKCYRVTMTARDGSQLSAFFKAK